MSALVMPRTLALEKERERREEFLNVNLNPHLAAYQRKTIYVDLRVRECFASKSDVCGTDRPRARNVRLENGKLTIEDRAGGKTLTLVLGAHGHHSL